MFVWALHSSGTFSVKSMYAALINNRVRVSQDLWQIKIPSRIKIFLWYLKRGVILTKDNLARRSWNGDTKCCFCHHPETIQHLFFQCYYAKFLWRAVHLMFGLSPPSVYMIYLLIGLRRVVTYIIHNNCSVSFMLDNLVNKKRSSF